MRGAWAKLGLRARLAISISAIVVVAFGVVFIAVRAQMSNEASVIKREEGREKTESKLPAHQPDSDGGSSISPIEDAQSDVQKTFLAVGALALAAALLAGYLLATRTASPLRRYAETAAEVDAGDLTPRLDPSPSSAAELRVLAESFNHMLDRLEEAFARQREFVSDASHELRSPLTAIRGQIEVLARSEHPDAAEVRRVEAMTMTEMRRVERLLSDLLALARLDEGAGTNPQDLEAGPFLRDLAGDDPAAALGTVAEGGVRADPDQIAQVLRNLLQNARRHAGPAGHVSITSRADGDHLRFDVDDDGPGIPPAERERVFDRFHRSDGARDRASGGSGLGLGIARAIVEAHGGRIWVEDSPSGGARVSFELPGFIPSVRDLSPNP